MNELIKISKLKTIVIMVVMFAAFNAKAGKEKYSNNASTKAASTTMLTNATALIVQDPRYVIYAQNPSVGWPGATSTPTSASVKFYDKNIKNRVIFSIDYSDKTATTGLSYSTTINFKVIYSIYNNTTSSFQTFTQNKSLTISSNQTAIDKDKAVCEFVGGNNFQVQVTGITFSNPLINITNARVQLEAEIELERYHYFNPASNSFTTLPKHCSNNLATKGELDVFWQPIVGAEEYELEWVFINGYSGTMASPTVFNYTTAASLTFDEKLFDFNTTRISTTNSFYKIPYIYEAGYILYRVRALGRTSATSWAYNVPAGWSTDMSVSSPPTNVSMFPTKFPSISVANGCGITTETFVGLNEGINWQSGISYAEEGKSKAVVSFSDGSLRNRQSVTKLKSKNEIVVGETIYDFQGRPVINVLPVPNSALQKIEYAPNFNMIGTNNPFDAPDFDFDFGNNCGGTSPVLVTSNGASKYYSSNNGLLTDENAYIPDAQGYPYTQTEFMPDNTGRIRNQSGVGPDHKLNSGHETRYFYGTPEQKDLDRLFGSEVGDGLKYKKNMVIDANGQPSITYMDPTGKTIATCLAGSTPTALTALPSQGTVLTTYDLLNKTLPTDNSGSLNLLDLANKKVSLNKTLLVPSNGPYTFTYSIKPPNFVDVCGGSLFVPPGATVTTTGTKCYNCILDTKISLKNECGEELFSNIYPVTPLPTPTLAAYNFTTTGSTSTVCAATNPSLSSVLTPSDVTNALSTTYLKPGSYVLEKTMSVNQAALDGYTKDYLDTLLNPCILKLSDFKNAQNAEMDITGCAITCTACLTKLGSASQYTVPSTCTVCLTQAEYDALYAECLEMCSEQSSKCENALAQMLADMSPSGQYGQYSVPSAGSAGNGNITIPTPLNIAPSGYPLSVYNTNNQLPFKTATNTTFTLAAAQFTASSNYSPDWRHPFNPNEATNAKKFAYLDEFKNIVYITVVPTGTNYVPAVESNHLGNVISSNGQYKVEPRYLDDIKDFITAWEPEWAYSLIAYHPEYVFYEKCLFDMPSNNFDAMYVETDKVVDMGIYMTSLSTATVNFMYPIGTPPSSGTVCGSWGGTIVDPYFQSTGSGSLQVCAMKLAMLNYMQSPTNPTVYISMWDAAYRAVNCPNGFTTGICPTTSMTPGHVLNDEEWQAFRGMYLSLKQSFQDRVNTIYGMNKTSYNQCIGAHPFDPFENNFYDYNNNVFTFTPTYYPFWNSMNPWYFPWTITNVSQFNNPEQTCHTNKYNYYTDKQARFPTMKMLMPDGFGQGGFPCYDNLNNIIPCPQSNTDVINNMANQVDLAMYQNCGQCPKALNFQQLLKGLATFSTTTGQQDLTNSSTPGVKLTCAPNASLHKEFTLELAQDLFTSSAPITDIYWKYNNAVSTALYLNGTFTHNSTACTMAIVMPSTIVPSPQAPNYTVSTTPTLLTSYAPFNNMYTFADVIDVCCLKHNPATFIFPSPINSQSGNERFTALVTVICKSGDPLYISSSNPTYRQISVEGYVSCEDFKNCSFNEVCQPSQEIKQIQNLLNALLFVNPSSVRAIDNAAVSTTLTNNSVASPGTVYNSFMQPTLIHKLNNVIQPSVNNVSDPWFWTYDATSSTTLSLVGYIKPQSSTPLPDQCKVNLTIPTFSAPSTYTVFNGYKIADLIKLTGVKPTTVATQPGAFEIYGLFKNASINGGVAAWVPITGTISCFSAGNCGNDVQGNFQLNQSSNEESEQIDCQAVHPAFFTEYFTNPAYGLITLFSTNSTTTFVGSNLGCSFTLTTNGSFLFNQITSVNSFYYVYNGGTSYQFGLSANSGLIKVNGVSNCPMSYCPNACNNKGNILTNPGFEEGNINFGTDYIYTPGSSLATGSTVTPTYFPYAASNSEKKYNVYSIKPTFNSTSTVSPVWVSDHTGVLYNTPAPPTYFTCDIAGNGNALAARNQSSAVSSGTGAAMNNVDYVWYQYVNLAPYKTYDFTAYYRGVPPFLSDTNQVNTIVAELYIGGVFKKEFYNTPNPSYKSLPLKSWNKMAFQYVTGATGNSNVKVAIKIYYAKVTGTVIEAFANGDGRSDDLFLLDDVSFEGCMLGNSMACNIPPSLLEEPEDDCVNDAQNTAFESAEYLYNAYMDSLRKAFQAKYIAKCLDANEDFFMKCNDTEHHYTLYYYDQAGNLVKTIPPQGVVRIPDGDPKLAQIKLDRKNNTQTVFTTHTYATNYKYNSLNQLVSQSMPDNNDLAIWNTNNFLGVNSSHSIQSVSFNGSNGFAVANDGTNGYLYTFNSTSNTWVLVPSLNVSTLNSVAYVDGTTAYAVGKNGTILRTINNGGNWTLMPFADGSAELIKVFQYDNSSPTPLAVAFDKNGNRYVSNIAGNVWTKTNNVFGFIGGETLKDVDYNYSTPTGLAVSNLNKIYTYNGYSWILNSNNFYQAALNKVTGDGNNVMYAVGKDGTIIKSTNNGNNWTEVQSNVSTELIDANFYTSSIGFLLDNNNKIYSTYNAAVTLNQINTVSYVGSPTSVNDIDYNSGTLFALNPTAGSVYTYNGVAWSGSANLVPAAISSVKTINAISATDFYVGGISATANIYKYSGSWAAVANIPALLLGKTIKQIDIKAGGTGYVLALTGELYYYDASAAPASQFQLISGTYNSVYYNGTNAIVITSAGDVKNYAGTSLIVASTFNLNSNANFNSVYLNTANNMAVVGSNTSNNTIAEISIGNPLQASPVYASKSGLTVPVTLNAVTTSNNGYIAGADGTVIKFNTGLLRWENQVTNSNTQLNTISASGSTIVAAGIKGAATGGFDDIVYNTGSGWNKVANSVDDYYSSKMVGNKIYFSGANHKLSFSTLPPVATQTVISGSGSGAEKLLAVNSSTNGSVTVVGEAGYIYYGNTTGVTAQGNINPPILNDIKWFDNTHVIAVGNTGQIIVSDNAGINWKVIPPSTGSTFNAVEILNANTAIVAATSNTLYQVSFSCAGPICTYTSAVYSTPALSGSGNYMDVSINNNDILVINDLGNAYYKSGAGSWTNISTAVTGLKSVHMVDNSFAFAVGSSAARVKINPAASTFAIPSPGSIAPSPTATPNFKSVLFKDYTTGYAVGTEGTAGIIIKTTNAGNTWTKENATTTTATNNINVIAPGPNNSLIVGGNGGASGNITDNKDEMSSRFYYDKLGRLVASQNSKQYAKNPLTYSYTRYDNLGRIYEVGEMLATASIESLPNTNNAQVDLTAFNTWLTTGIFTEITKTYYTNPIVLPPNPLLNYYDGAGTFTQTNLRNRVSYTTYQDVASTFGYDHATYYSYDVHGNVSSLYQFNKNLPAGNKYKRVDYDYDLISGKVNNVYYQKGAKDQFSHQYAYDDDNRITNVYTSKDDVIWDQDAKYFYYRHGPLARTEIGDNKVQGIDYAYTIQGWIKGVNSEKQSWINDQGNDAMTFTATTNNVNNFVSKDAMGYHLGYFNNDYISIVPGSASPSTYFLADKTGSPLNSPTVKPLYNGNISEAGYSIKKLIDLAVSNPYHGAAYSYDQLNRLVATANFNTFDATNNKYITPTNANAYNEAFTYDANGNILTLQRKDGGATTAGMLDNLTYNYKNIASGNLKNTNQLTSVSDATSTPIADDIENQSANNYDYDNIGNLIKDDQEKISNIEWTVYGKIKKITRTVVAGAGSDLEFMYDAGGNRVCKIEKTKTAGGVLNPQSQWNYTYYTRDAQGNTMGTYQVNPLVSANLYLTEQHLYGSSRLGVLTRSEDMVAASPATDIYERFAGNKGFEFGNHLGNVLTVVSDRKLFVDDGVYSTAGLSISTSTDGIIDYYTPDILSATDYYAFGSPLPGRLSSSVGYRYGFNGKENDNEFKGNGNSQDFGARIHDPRLGRFLSIDNFASKAPMLTPYHFCSNAPMSRVDGDGNWDIEVHAYGLRKIFGYAILVVKDNSGNEVYRAVVRVQGLKNKIGKDRSIPEGDTPTGTYNILNWQPYEDNEARGKFGPNARLRLQIIEGEGKEKRSGIALHGGRQEVYDKETNTWSKKKNANLWNAQGCMRIKDAEIAEIIKITKDLETNNPGIEKPGTLTVKNDLFTMNGKYYAGADAKSLLLIANQSQNMINASQDNLGTTNPYELKAAGINPAPSQATLDAVDNFFKTLDEATKSTNNAKTDFESKGIVDKKY